MLQRKQDLFESLNKVEYSAKTLISLLTVDDVTSQGGTERNLLEIEKFSSEDDKEVFKQLNKLNADLEIIRNKYSSVRGIDLNGTFNF